MNNAAMKTRAAFLLNGKWQWKTWTHGDGNKHAAIIAKATELGAEGWDFGQADHELASCANF